MKKSRFAKILLALIFTFASLSAYGKIYYKYEPYFKVKVFAKPSTDSEMLGQIRDEVIETEFSDLESQWIEIPYEGGVGYILRYDVCFIGEKRTGKDDITYNKKLDMVAEKIGHPCSEQTTLILTSIAAFLSLIAIFLPRIKGKGGWISGFCLLAVSILILTYIPLFCGYLPDMGLDDTIELFLHPVLLILVYKAAQSVYYSMGNYKGVEVKWNWGFLLAVAGGACLYANREFFWNMDDQILVGYAIAQLLFSAYIAICLKSSLAIPVAISWWVLSFVIMNLTYVAVPATLIILVVLVTLLVLGSAMSAAGIFGGRFFVTTSGTILKSIFGGGYVDSQGNKYHDVGGGRVTKD